MQETRVQSLGWEDLLEKSTAPHSSIPCIYLFLAVPGLRGGSGFSLAVASRGDALVAVSRLLTAVASLAAGPEGSAVAARGL